MKREPHTRVALLGARLKRFEGALAYRAISDSCVEVKIDSQVKAFLTLEIIGTMMRFGYVQTIGPRKYEVNAEHR